MDPSPQWGTNVLKTKKTSNCLRQHKQFLKFAIISQPSFGNTEQAADQTLVLRGT